MFSLFEYNDIDTKYSLQINLLVVFFIPMFTTTVAAVWVYIIMLPQIFYALYFDKLA